jgi:NAD(P)-dependent dehydrogenase (short-subunit alcohol dehydrogenase family)
MNDKPVAVITGASRGIGRSVAIALAAEGYDIAAIARSVDSEGMENLGPDVENRGAQFFPIGLDISCTSCQKEVVSNILDRYGRIDILINNAGVSPPHWEDVLNMTEESYNRVMNINLKGPVFFAQKIAREMVWLKQQISACYYFHDFCLSCQILNKQGRILHVKIRTKHGFDNFCRQTFP